MRKNNLISKRAFSIILTIAVALSMMLTIAWADANGWMSTQSDAVEMANANEANGSGAALSNVRLLSEINETIKRTAEVKCVVPDGDAGHYRTCY